MDERTVVRAMLASMEVVRDYQRGVRKRSDATKVKLDGTFVTGVDADSGLAARPHLSNLPPNYAIKSEDVEGRESSVKTNELLEDSLDGTDGFLLGLPTPTVIMADYDSVMHRLTGCWIGLPATGQVWSASKGSGPVLMSRYADWKGHTLTACMPTKVWEGPMDRKSAVFLDVSHGFARDGGKREILSGDNSARLLANLSRKTKILIPGSNGLMHALVANGGEGLAGGITTAMGGEWDAAGVYLVLRAGGFARAFRVHTHPKELCRKSLTEANPLDPYAYDIVAFGNSKETVDVLVDALNASIV